MARKFKVDPYQLIPYHQSKPTAYWIYLYRNRLFQIIPPIPVVRAPEDLKHLGDYVNYNGHHRTESAKKAGVEPLCYLIESDEDIQYLRIISEVYDELIDGLDNKFVTHRAFVCGEARRYNALRKLALVR